MEKIIVSVEGMSCNHCVATIEEHVGKIAGVHETKADLTTKQVTVQFDPSHVTEQAIKDVIENQGFDVV